MSTNTYLLLEPGVQQAAEPSGIEWPTIEIDVLALTSEWDMGIILSLEEGKVFLEALQENQTVGRSAWEVKPGWLSLRDSEIDCTFELCPPTKGALIYRLQTVLIALCFQHRLGSGRTGRRDESESSGQSLSGK